MNDKPKPFAEFSHLTFDQKQLIKHWASIYSIRKLVLHLARPAPAGLAIITNKSVLQRYLKRLELDDHRDLLQDEIQSVAHAVDLAALGQVKFHDATLKLVEKRAFELALNPETDPAQIKSLYYILFKHRDLQIRQDRQDLARQKHEYKKKTDEEKRQQQVEAKYQKLTLRCATHRLNALSYAQACHEDPDNRYQLQLDVERYKTEEQHDEQWCKEHNLPYPNEGFASPAAILEAAVYAPHPTKPELTLTRGLPAGQKFEPKPVEQNTPTPSAPPLRQVLECGDSSPLSSAPQPTHTPQPPSVLSNPTSETSNLPPSALPLRQVLECGDSSPLSSARHPTHPPQPPSVPPNSPETFPPSLPAPSVQTDPNPPSPVAVRQHPSLEQMAKASDRYARARVREHADYTINIRRLTTHKLPSYESQLRQCPCGSQLPCPWHQPFPDRFWRITPFTPDYRYFMEERGIPFQEPEDMLA